MEFVGDHSVFYINKTCSEVLYNCNRILVTKIGFFTPQDGKFETDQYIVKYSKGDLFLYDKLTKNVIESFTFNCFKIITLDPDAPSPPGPPGPGVPPPQHGDLKVATFQLLKDHIIVLYRKEDGSFFIINKGVKENVTNITDVGSDRRYTTEKGNVLSVGTIRNSTFNGAPVGRT